MQAICFWWPPEVQAEDVGLVGYIPEVQNTSQAGLVHHLLSERVWVSQCGVKRKKVKAFLALKVTAFQVTMR